MINQKKWRGEDSGRKQAAFHEKNKDKFHDDGFDI
jgi:hypothetical protein